MKRFSTRSSPQARMIAVLDASWRMPAGVHGKAGSTPVPGRKVWKLSSILVASRERLRRMPKELHGPRFESGLLHLIAGQ
jgi:hypothetical protein